MINFVNGSAIVAILAIMVALFSPSIRNSLKWRAMVTPLASIIGSGFLIVGPLLWILVGKWSLYYLGFIIFLSYQIGGVVRFNILNGEPLLGTQDKPFHLLQKASYFSLGLSYVVSIAFYAHILSAFAFKAFGIDNPFYNDLLATALLLFIGISGLIRGIDRLELFNIFAVNIKIALVCAVCMGVFVYNWHMLDFIHIVKPSSPEITFKTIQKIAGILLLVQGFETARYLGHKYKAVTRVSAMKYAQILSSIIYTVLVWCLMFVMGNIDCIKETTIIEILMKLSPLLAYILISGAVFSQFSSALADTIGCSGLLSESVKSKISLNQAYFLTSLVAIVLIWTTDVFENIALASRCFALYYFVQSVEAIYVGLKHKKSNLFEVSKHVIVSLFMLFVCIFARSASS